MGWITLILLPLPLVSFSQSDSVEILDISNAAHNIIPAGTRPDFIATDGKTAWIIDDAQNRIIKVSAESKMPLLTVPVTGACAIPVVGFNAVWVMSCSEKALYKIDKTNGNILKVIQTGIADNHGEMSLAKGKGSIWLLSDSTGTLMQINPKTNSIQKRIQVAPNSYCTAFGHSSIWVTNYFANSVQRINIKKGIVVATIPVGPKPRFLSAEGKSVWTLNQGDGTVSKINPSTNKVTATIDAHVVGPGGDITSDTRNVWVVSTNPERPVQSIDALTNSIHTIYMQTGEKGKKLRVDGAVRLSPNYIWISGYYNKTIWVLNRIVSH